MKNTVVKVFSRENIYFQGSIIEECFPKVLYEHKTAKMSSVDKGPFQSFSIEIKPFIKFLWSEVLSIGFP